MYGAVNKAVKTNNHSSSESLLPPNPAPPAMTLTEPRPRKLSALDIAADNVIGFTDILDIERVKGLQVS